MKKNKASLPAQDLISSNGNDNFLIVGIGASAGGIQALQDFFRHVRRDSGCAYVVILHLSPDHDSKLVEVLKTVASIKVSTVKKRTKVQPDNIYVISPNHHLTMIDGDITVSENQTTEDRRAPVDIFFRTLAETHGERAVCVVLSGTGANGSMGIKRVKEKGGVAFVQSPKEAEFSEMPHNSIDTGLIDDILLVADIPDQILLYKSSITVPKISVEPETRTEDEQQALREIFTQIRVRTGHDFSNYKRPTLLRRIERRINIRNLPTLSAYANYLQQNPDEITALLKDLLISVTNFFRDPKAFLAIDKEVFPSLINRARTDKKLRIWVAGCATGEEAYSLAMLCAEHTTGMIDVPKIHIFATDIDESAIATAREGIYTINDAADVSPDRLRRFFVKENDGYRVKREIREMILFATHNFLRDPPFSRLNMITCRNALIYLNHHAQERLLETFHFALNPGGFLFLGNSESVDGANDLYSTFKKDLHIYQSRQVGARNYPVPDSIPNFRLTQEHHLQRLEEKELRAQQRITFGELHQRLLDEYSPPSVVVNEEYDIVHMSDKVGKFFEFPGGEPSPNLLKVIRPEIRLDLRSALYKAVQRNAPVEARNVKLKLDDRLQAVTIHVRPALQTDNTSKGFILVVFETQAIVEPTPEVVLATDEPVAKQLEEELIRVKAQLRNSNEQHELQAEELKASNEELQAINEELRSAAEELETSKEELQSINEELRTVNQELKIKVEEVSLSSNNLQNLINSADVGTIFLDRSLQIKLFTPAVSQLFNLRSSDHGRPITDITNRIEYTGLIDDAEKVLESLSIVDREVTTDDKRSFLIRLRPYRTKEDRIDGVVITFIDISVRRQAEDALIESQQRFRTLTDTVPQLIWATDAAGIPHYFNQRWFAFSGLNFPQSVELGWQSLVHPEDEAPMKRRWEQSLESGKALDGQCRLRSASGEYPWHIVRSVPLKDPNGKVLGWFGSATDIQGLKTAQESQNNISERLQLALEAGQLGSFEYDFKNDTVISTPQHRLNYGLEENEEFTFGLLQQIVLPADRHLIEPAVAKQLDHQKTYSTEYRIKLNNNSFRWIKSVGRVLRNEEGDPQKLVGITIDVTELKEFTAELSKQVNERTVELRRSNDDLIQFAHVASHDLKEPIRKIKIFTGRLINDFGELLPENGKNYLEKIQKATARMFSMIDGILNYSMLGIFENSFSLVDLNKTIEQIQTDLEMMITQKGAVIVAGGLPVIRANATLITQVFYNLINNSLKFAKPDEPPIITITHSQIVRDGTSYLKIELADNGIGFENEFAEKIFESFSRLNTKDRYEGTGLGLALSKKIIERHGGLIFSTGELGKGAVFTILLPN